MKTKQTKLKIDKGDVVLIQEDDVKRNRWRLGRIQEVISGSDGVFRGAVLKTCRDGKAGQIKRPLQKLYPLELKEESDVSRQDRVADVGDRIGGDTSYDGDHQNLGHNGRKLGQNSEFLGPLGVATSEKLLSKKTNLKSLRTAAVDGQTRRRINDVKNI